MMCSWDPSGASGVTQCYLRDNRVPLLPSGYCIGCSTTGAKPVKLDEIAEKQHELGAVLGMEIKNLQPALRLYERGQALGLTDEHMTKAVEQYGLLEADLRKVLGINDAIDIRHAVEHVMEMNRRYMATIQSIRVQTECLRAPR